MTYHTCLRHGPCITNIWLNNKTCIEIINNNITICACALYLNSESWQCLSRLAISLPCLWNRGGKTLTLRTESRPRENNLHTTKVFYFSEGFKRLAYKNEYTSECRLHTRVSIKRKNCDIFFISHHFSPVKCHCITFSHMTSSLWISPSLQLELQTNGVKERCWPSLQGSQIIFIECNVWLYCNAVYFIYLYT